MTGFGESGVNSLGTWFRCRNIVYISDGYSSYCYDSPTCCQKCSYYCTLCKTWVGRHESALLHKNSSEHTNKITGEPPEQPEVYGNAFEY